ncbi:MAG: hypothetical protein BLITH_0310 [Brockia lithotrophica]|uniref:Uncharacterized protein n=1 Tax=Brockia lithotrophica TaxID=933949 RepID=A0A2T5GAM9_9BACL|nr:MAG: hypothetical protein BLITH_0310 [Brockia lithotrophica]
MPLLHRPLPAFPHRSRVLPVSPKGREVAQVESTTAIWASGWEARNSSAAR